MLSFRSLRETLQKPESRRFIRFLLAGCFASAVYYITALALDFLKVMPTMAANTVAYILSIAASYTSQKIWAFRDTSSHSKAFPRFLLSSLLGFALNSAIVWTMLRAAIPFYISSFTAMAAVAFFSYFFQRYFVFTKVRG